MIDIFAGCGVFCQIWFLSWLAWKPTALFLLALGAAGFLWKSFRFRQQMMWISFILLIMHLGNVAYLSWRYP